MGSAGDVTLAMAVSSSVRVTAVRSQEVMAKASKRIAMLNLMYAMVYLLGGLLIAIIDASDRCKPNAKNKRSNGGRFCEFNHGKPHQVGLGAVRVATLKTGL